LLLAGDATILALFRFSIEQGGENLNNKITGSSYIYELTWQQALPVPFVVSFLLFA
jgi:hypothetical protein